MTVAAAKPKTAVELIQNPIYARQAYDETAPERAAVDDSRLLAVSVVVERIVPVVLAAADRIQPFMKRMDALPELKVELVRDLPRRTLALVRADEVLMLASGDKERVKALLAEGLPIREQLFEWAPTLVGWKIFPQDQLDVWRSGSGHTDAGADLVSMGEAYLAEWPRIAGKVNLNEQAPRRAVEIGRDLLVAIGAKSSRDEVKAAIRDRQAAFTLVVEAYDEARRAVSYLRWHEGDAEELLPSIYAAGRRTKPKAAAAPAEPATPQA